MAPAKRSSVRTDNTCGLSRIALIAAPQIQRVAIETNRRSRRQSAQCDVIVDEHSIHWRPGTHGDKSEAPGRPNVKTPRLTAQPRPKKTVATNAHEFPRIKTEHDSSFLSVLICAYLWLKLLTSFPPCRPGNTTEKLFFAFICGYFGVTRKSSKYVIESATVQSPTPPAFANVLSQPCRIRR
jgi:hypothetical protein